MWLLENDVRYTLYLIKSLQKEEDLGVSQTEGHSKDSLFTFEEYALSFTEIQTTREQHLLKMISWWASAPIEKAPGRRYVTAELMALQTLLLKRTAFQGHAYTSCSITCGRSSKVPPFPSLLSRQ